MSIRVCLFPAGTLSYPNGGGYLWIYLNWALGFRSLGCEVIWLEGVSPTAPAQLVQLQVATLKNRLERYGLAESLALCSWTGEPLPAETTAGCMNLDNAAEADLLLNQRYGAPSEIVGRFRRSALLDIDPGLLQIWISKGWIEVARHDLYFTISEAVAEARPPIPDTDLRWQHAPPCVSLDLWSPHKARAAAPFTTLTHWYAGGGAEDSGEAYADDKRSGFLPFLDLPQRTSQPLELALDVAADANIRASLNDRGWRVRDAYEMAATPWDYQRYVQDSLGEFSCAKPSYVRYQTAWISDRTVCYLASTKPAVVQHTGPSKFLPDSAGLFRFRNISEAAHALEQVARDYEQHCRLARTLAEELFDAKKVAGSVLDRSLT
jgi:hypothetical protein